MIYNLKSSSFLWHVLGNSEILDKGICFIYNFQGSKWYFLRISDPKVNFGSKLSNLKCLSTDSSNFEWTFSKILKTDALRPKIPPYSSDLQMKIGMFNLEFQGDYRIIVEIISLLCIEIPPTKWRIRDTCNLSSMCNTRIDWLVVFIESRIFLKSPPSPTIRPSRHLGFSKTVCVRVSQKLALEKEAATPPPRRRKSHTP